ncbi:hypothetical protein D3C85_1888070 [compost metagenome]
MVGGWLSSICFFVNKSMQSAALKKYGGDNNENEAKLSRAKEVATTIQSGLALRKP